MACIGKVSVQDAMKHTTLTFKVVGMRRLRARLWLGKQLVGLAGVIIGCKTIVDTDPQQDVPEIIVGPIDPEALFTGETVKQLLEARDTQSGMFGKDFAERLREYQCDGGKLFAEH